MKGKRIAQMKKVMLPKKIKKQPLDALKSGQKGAKMAKPC